MATVIVVFLTICIVVLSAWVVYRIKRDGTFTYQDGIAVLGVLVSGVTIFLALPEQNSSELTVMPTGVMPTIALTSSPSSTTTLVTPTQNPVLLDPTATTTLAPLPAPITPEDTSSPTPAQPIISYTNVANIHLSKSVDIRSYRYKRVEIADDESMYALYGEDKYIYVMNSASDELVVSIKNSDSSEIKDAVFSANNKTLTAMSFDGRLRFWGIPSGELMKVLDICKIGYGPDSPPQNIVPIDIAYSPDGNMLAIACDDSSIEIMDTETYEIVSGFWNQSNTLASIEWSDDGGLLAANIGNGVVHLWEVATTLNDLPSDDVHTIVGEDLIGYVGYEVDGIQETILRFSRDGAMIISGDWRYGLVLLDISAGKSIIDLCCHYYAAADLSPNGQLLAVSTDVGVDIFRTADGVLIHSEDISTNEDIIKVLFSSDGYRIIVITNRYIRYFSINDS